MDSTEAAFVMNLTSILLKVAERLVRAGADVCRCTYKKSCKGQQKDIRERCKIKKSKKKTNKC